MDILGWIGDFFGQIGDLLNGLLMAILSILPDSPFQYLSKNEIITKYLGYLNYFIPINFFISVLQTWLVAVGAFYVWQLLLRWLKAIE